MKIGKRQRALLDTLSKHNGWYAVASNYTMQLSVERLRLNSLIECKVSSINNRSVITHIKLKY